ncbi:hypothetical protein GGE65_007337 [Skermanella aerolata]
MLAQQEQTRVNNLREQSQIARNAGCHEAALQNVQKALKVIGV